MRQFVELEKCVCGKVSYGSHSAAVAARAAVVGRDRLREEQRKRELVVYICDASGKHHLGRGPLKPIPRQRKKPSRR
jgi:hypothetical protein